MQLMFTLCNQFLGIVKKIISLSQADPTKCRLKLYFKRNAIVRLNLAVSR